MSTQTTGKLLKECFQTPAFAIVMLEDWREIVFRTDVRTMALLAQTCKAFWQLVEEIRKKNLGIALEYRRIEQILLAKKCLMMCANYGIPEAMFHLGYAKLRGGFGFKSFQKPTDAYDWIKKASGAGYPLAMVHLATSYSDEVDQQTKTTLKEKVLQSNCPLAIAAYWSTRTYKPENFIKNLRPVAEGGNEFAQNILACECITDKHELLSCTANEECLYWFEKSAIQGHMDSQRILSDWYNRTGNKEKAQFWQKKIKIHQNL